MSPPASNTSVDSFALPKGTGTYADALAALGLQQLLALLSDLAFSLRDAGDRFELRLPHGQAVDLDALDYESVRRTAGYRYVHLPKDGMARVPDEIDYEEERRKLLVTRAMQDTIRKAKRQPTEEEREQLALVAPMPNWSLYQNVNVLQGFGGYISLHHEIRAADPTAFALTVRNRLAALARPEAPAQPGKTFGGKVSAVQVFNPVAGKGTSDAKPRGSGLKNLQVDWFEEWLRYIGLGIAARSIVMNKKDIKVWVLGPHALRPASVNLIADEFRSLPDEYSPAKADVLLSVRLALGMLRRSGLIDGSTDQIGIRSRYPRDAVSGLHTAFFKSLGKSPALTNLAFIGLPGWFPISEQSINDWADTLTDHDRVLRQLDERITDQAVLLLLYRDFLSAGPEMTSSLLEFLAGYAVYVFRGRGEGRHVPALRLGVLSSFLRRLSMEQGSRLTEVLENQGFQRIAAAIRRATISEQFYKAKNGRQDFEIRYGLLQELHRKARFKAQFVNELAEFVSLYNFENARKAEQLAQSGQSQAFRRWRRQVTTDDIAAVVRLLDDHESETVARLLLAFAAASDAPAATDIDDGNMHSEPGSEGQDVAGDEE